MFRKLFPNNGNGSSSKKAILVKNIEDIPGIYAEKINEVILTEELHKAVSFMGGDFNIDLSPDEKNYTCSYVLYFQDKNAQTYEAESEKQAFDIERLSEEAKNDLLSQKNIKFEIPELSKEIRLQYKVVKK